MMGQPRIRLRQAAFAAKLPRARGRRIRGCKIEIRTVTDAEKKPGFPSSIYGTDGGEKRGFSVDSVSGNEKIRS